MTTAYASVVLPTIRAVRYVTPLREGGSLPGIVEADDDGTYVLKFRGAGQGPKVLVAEVVVGEIARALGIRVPDLRAVDLDARIARYEADEEVQDLLTASVGLNLGVDFLPGAFGYDGARPPSPEEAARILWLDAFTANVDRTWSNPNLLVWHGRTWAIDHGAALYFQHSWPRSGSTPAKFAAQPFDASTHVLREVAGDLAGTDAALTRLVTPDLLGDVLSLVPDEWLEPAPGMDHPGGGPRGVRREPAGTAGRPPGLAARPRPGGPPVSGPLVGYQYVVLRCVPRVDRDEFLNVGVVLYSQQADFLDVAYSLDPDRLSALAPGLDLEAVEASLRTLADVCAGRSAPGLPVIPRPGPRFGWISAPRSTVLQPGPVHGGLTADPAATLATLVHRLVG